MNKVALLVSDSLGTKALSHLLIKQKINISKIIVQIPTPQQPVTFIGRVIILIKKRGKNIVSYIKERKVASKVNSIENKLKLSAQSFLKENITTTLNYWPTDIPVFYTSNINSDDTYNQLINNNIGLIVVWGTSILKPKLLSIPNVQIINAHTSILPSYKGTFSEFWQCFYQDYETMGITFHFIDIGVDTGDIIFQKSIKTVLDIDPFMLRALNTLSILQYYPQVILSVLKNNHTRTKQILLNKPALTYSDITLEKKNSLYKKINLM